MIVVSINNCATAKTALLSATAVVRTSDRLAISVICNGRLTLYTGHSHSCTVNLTDMIISTV